MGEVVLKAGVGEGSGSLEETDGLVVQAVVMSCAGWEREWWWRRLAELGHALRPHCIDAASRSEWLLLPRSRENIRSTRLRVLDS